MNSTREKIISAAISQISEHGYVKSTTKSIAEKAGVNELTLFRLFDSKKGLMEAVLETTIGPFIKTLETLSLNNELETDLKLLAEAYLAFASQRQSILTKILPETSNPEIGEFVIPLQKAIVTHMMAILEKHKNALRVDVPNDVFILAFFGPLLATAFLGHVLKSTDWDIKRYVRSYLYGYARSPDDSAELPN